MPRIERGARVIVRDAFGTEHDRWAVTGIVPGHSMQVVWVTREAEADWAPMAPGDEGTIPWPSEDVRLKGQGS